MELSCEREGRVGSWLNHNRRMLARLCAFLVWALVAATSVFWGLRLLVRSPPAPAHAVAVNEADAARGDLTRLLGAAPVAAVAAAASPDASARFRLLGIMAPKANSTNRHGFAVIAVDGKPARAFAVGARVDGELVLQSVSWRAASIGPAQGVPVMTLELPPLLAAATGALPGTGGVMAPVVRGMPRPGAARPVAPQSVAPQGLPVQPMPYQPDPPLPRLLNGVPMQLNEQGVQMQ